MNDNKILFVRWIRAQFPEVYAQAVRQALQAQPPATLSGLLDSIKSGIDRFIASIPSLTQTYVNAKAQVDWVKLNVERAKNGLPPLDPTTGQPMAGSNVQAPPPATAQDKQVEAALASASSTASVPIWIWFGLAGGILWLLLKRRRR